MTLQIYHLGNDIWERDSDPSTPTYLSSPYLYTIGTIGGIIRPFGDAHIVGKMGGLWSHPLRLLQGWSLAIDSGDGHVSLEPANSCHLYGSHLVREFLRNPLRILWTEFTTDSLPILASIIQVQNNSDEFWEGSLYLDADVDLHSPWFSDWNIEETELSIAKNSLLFSIQMAGTTHSFLLGTSTTDAYWNSPSHGPAYLEYRISLSPGSSTELHASVAIVHQEAKAAIPQIVEQFTGNEKILLQEKIENYTRVDKEISINTPNSILNQGWRIARLNLQLLMSDYRPFMPPYFLAGLPEYPQLFGCDTTYSIPGALAAGFQSQARLSLLALAEVAIRQNGKVPHELTTSGRVYNPGNTQETPQFVIAVWDYFRWTGDLDLLRNLYPLCRRGMLEAIPEEFGLLEMPYLQGNGMVEVEGMAELKLDVQAYYLRGLQVLGEMAKILKEDIDETKITSSFQYFLSRFQSDWWIPSEELYADSMHVDGRTRFDGHWTVVVPLQLGLLPSHQANNSLQRISKDWVNRWGMVHTRRNNDQVWTLPTGLLALTSFAYGDPKQGISLLENIAATSHYGSLGTLSELIPDGLCFIQLWSAAILLQGIIEGLLGIQPDAHKHHLSIAPKMPVHWNEMQLTGLTVGSHILDLNIGSSRFSIRHKTGPGPLDISYTHNKISETFQLGVGDERQLNERD